LHDASKDVIGWLKDLGVVFDRQDRKAYIFYKNTYIPFPIQTHLAYLPVEEKEFVLQSIIDANGNAKKVNNLHDFLYKGFGEILCEKFFVPYNQKLWKIPLKNIGINWKERILKPALEKILT
jgi:protoporphyrinogen oxidase